MAQYKVPQDVEAEDKLLGPFTFRQFVYLLIAGGLIAVAVGLFQIFPILGIVPIIPALLFLALALPLKKDQPMETYLAAIVSYWLKPRTKIWAPGQRESTILITAPKIVESVRTRDLSEEEATHRLSFLADIVDTEGYAIKGAGQSSMREDLVAEANATQDMFDTYRSENLDKVISEEKQARHNEVIEAMRDAIERNENWGMGSDKKRAAKTTGGAGTSAGTSTGGVAQQNRVTRNIEPAKQGAPANVNATTGASSAASANPATVAANGAMNGSTSAYANATNPAEKDVTTQAKPSIIELANNSDFSIATIAKEANRIKRKDEGEVFIALH